MAPGQAANEIKVAIEEIVGGQIGRALPNHLREDAVAEFAGLLRNTEENQQNRTAASVLKLVSANLFADLGGDVEFFLQLPQ